MDGAVLDAHSALPQHAFHLWCIIARNEDLVRRYERPPNVVGITNVVLYAGDLPRGQGRVPPAVFDAVRRFHEPHQGPDGVQRRLELLWNTILPALADHPGGVPVRDLLLGDETCELVLRRYEERTSTLSFIDFFYTYLFSHLPLVRLLAEPVPPARLYHATSTGFAGFLAARAPPTAASTRAGSAERAQPHTRYDRWYGSCEDAARGRSH